MPTGLADCWMHETGDCWGFIIEPPVRETSTREQEISVN